MADLTAAVLRHDPRQELGLARERLLACRTRLDRSLERTLHASAAHISALDARLHSLSPLAVLERGYALVLDAARRAGAVNKSNCGGRQGHHAPLRRRFHQPRGIQALRNETMSAANARKLFGTDGIRAVAGESPLDPTTIFACGLALGHSLRKTAR